MLVYWITLAVLFPGLATALTFSFPFRAQSPTADILPDQPYLQETTTQRVDYVCHSGPERRFRFSYGSGPGVDVYGWPSKGGVYVLHDCLGVELDFLGYDRFDLPLDLVEPQPEEDAHCDLSESPLSPLCQMLKCKSRILSLRGAFCLISLSASARCDLVETVRGPGQLPIVWPAWAPRHGHG